MKSSSEKIEMKFYFCFRFFGNTHILGFAQGQEIFNGLLISWFGV
jgi:hypothetical protein